MAAWALLFLFRKVGFEHVTWAELNNSLPDANLWRGLVIVPLGWITLYTLQGSYKNVLRKSRLKELQQTLLATLIGSVVLFFALLLDDQVGPYRNYYVSFLFLFFVHFGLTYTCRLLQTSSLVRKVHNRQIGFPTLLIGSHSKAYKTYLDLENQETYSGNTFVGFVEVEGTTDCGACESRLTAVMPRLGTTNDVPQLIAQHHIEEVIIAVEDTEHTQIQQILRMLDGCGEVIIKITPDARDIILGMVRIDSIFHSPLITINTRLMEEWQYSVKRMFDIILSLLALILLSAPSSSSPPSWSNAPAPAPSSTPKNASDTVANHSKCTNSAACIPMPKLAVPPSHATTTHASHPSDASCAKYASTKYPNSTTFSKAPCQ